MRSKRNRVEQVYQRNGPGPAGLSLEVLKHMAGVVSPMPLSQLSALQLNAMASPAKSPRHKDQSTECNAFKLRALMPINPADAWRR